MNKGALKKLDGYGGSLKAAAAMAFLEDAVDTLGIEAFVSK